MPPYRILILSDGRPGHFNLAEGIAAAIERIRPASTTRHDVRRGRWPGAVVAALTRARLPGRAMMKSVYCIDEADIPACDIILSAGAETLGASVWLARTRGVANIFYGSLRQFDPRDFSLVLTSYQRNAARPRHALALKPSRFDPDTAPSLSEPGTSEQRNLGLLIGGDAGGIHYTEADWQALLDIVRSYGSYSNARWLIANSRRTPEGISDMFAREARRAGTLIGEFLDVRTAGPGTLAALLAQCHAVLCTTDSSSMISECIWSRKPTLSLAPAISVHTRDEVDYRLWLESSGWCREMPISGISPAQIAEALARLTPLRTNPVDELAHLLRQRLPFLAG